MPIAPEIRRVMIPTVFTFSGLVLPDCIMPLPPLKGVRLVLKSIFVLKSEYSLKRFTDTCDSTTPITSITACSQLKEVNGSGGYFTENASPMTTRNTARMRKGARTCAIQVLIGLALIELKEILTVHSCKHRKISQDCEIGWKNSQFFRESNLNPGLLKYCMASIHCAVYPMM
jgi:hypothetical protein